MEGTPAAGLCEAEGETLWLAEVLGDGLAELELELELAEGVGLEVGGTHVSG